MLWRGGDRRCADRLDQFEAVVRAGHLDVVRIDRVYLQGKQGQGCKVMLSNLTRDLMGDAWLWYFYPIPGDVLAVRGGVGWGPHNQNEVLYIGDRRSGHGVFDRVDAKTFRRAFRHRARAVRQRS